MQLFIKQRCSRAWSLRHYHLSIFFIFASVKEVNLTSSGTLWLAPESSKKFKHSVDPSFPRLESIKAVKTQSELTSAPACQKKMLQSGMVSAVGLMTKLRPRCSLVALAWHVNQISCWILLMILLRWAKIKNRMVDVYIYVKLSV